ncbi:MAG: hypothetical protein OXC54_10415 [Rhodospirillaceae bacterium]|nr:hypothetical protein [Rhodospirillaceae bacterium]MCY4311702.1 hypothetical protein [Rhodospirillaceae bacterium]
MNRSFLSFMIVKDFSVEWAELAVGTFEASALLAIDADRILSRPVISQRFQAIAEQIP